MLRVKNWSDITCYPWQRCWVNTCWFEWLILTACQPVWDYFMFWNRIYYTFIFTSMCECFSRDFARNYMSFEFIGDILLWTPSLGLSEYQRSHFSFRRVGNINTAASKLNKGSHRFGLYFKVKEKVESTFYLVENCLTGSPCSGDNLRLRPCAKKGR